MEPPSYKLLYKPWNNPHELVRYIYIYHISTINHRFQPLINYLNAIDWGPHPVMSPNFSGEIFPHRPIVPGSAKQGSLKRADLSREGPETLRHAKMMAIPPREMWIFSKNGDFTRKKIGTLPKWRGWEIWCIEPRRIESSHAKSKHHSSFNPKHGGYPTRWGLKHTKASFRWKHGYKTMKKAVEAAKLRIWVSRVCLKTWQQNNHK